MANFFPPQGTFLDWNYVTYFGDGIPLLFWVFAYPYDPCTYSNEYRWTIFNPNTSIGTKFSYANTLAGTQNSFLKFPNNSNYTSNVLYNLTTQNTTIRQSNGRKAVIVVDSPWARSCISRETAPSSKTNENYAVGLSIEMGTRIAQTYPNWSQWWNNICSSCGCQGTESLSLLPGYLKSALTQAAGNGHPYGGIDSVDILMFNPNFNNTYSPSEEQPGLLLPEIVLPSPVAKIIGTQCSTDTYHWPVNPFGKAFLGAFVAIYKDHTQYDVAVVNNLLIDVPWSGVLTGVKQYKMNATLPSPQCSLSCPSHIYFDSTAQVALCDNSITLNDYLWQDAYGAPHSFPRVGCAGRGGFDPCFGGGPGTIIDPIWQSTPAGGFQVNAGDGLGINSCNYPSYYIGDNPDSPLYYDFREVQDPQILPFLGPWAVAYSPIASRLYAAGGGCQDAAFQPWDL
jgi:hypothetical protein